MTPNAATLVKGSMYASSRSAGDWERFIADDLVASIDGRFRTLTHRMSRGIAGHDAGGEAALRIGMKRPEVFANLYAMNPSAVDAVTAELESVSNLDAYYAISIDVGAADPSLALTRQLHGAMTKLGFPTPTRSMTATVRTGSASESNRACCRSSRETWRLRPT